MQKKPQMLNDVLRALLLVLSAIAVMALLLILLPQPAVDKMVQIIELRHPHSQQEKIALLYLGDETANNELRIRGVVRNITALPIEQLDAVLRLYAHDRSLLETTVVRMSKAIIGPNEIVEFELRYPNYQSEYAGYSTEFKLRQGTIVPYRDLRRLPAHAK